MLERTPARRRERLNKIDEFGVTGSSRCSFAEVPKLRAQSDGLCKDTGSRGSGLSDCRSGEGTTYFIAASTMAMSCSVVPPLTPTPATTWPSLVKGTPPPIAEYLPPETARRG